MHEIGVGTRRTRGARLAALSALVLLPLPGALAFEYDEHCRVSNDALMIALAKARTAGLDEERAAWVERRATDECRNARGTDRPTSYGKWVGLADYAVQATDLYVHEENPSAWKQLVEDVIPEDEAASLGGSWLRGLLASHLNEEHFQDRALFAHWLWHRQAVRLAAEGKLASGLFINAYADHFLEDSLAPGHVMTPRREFHDVPALAMHDHYNRKGDRYFPIRTACLAELVSGLPAEACRWAGWCDEEPLAPHLEALEASGVLMKGDGRLFDAGDERLLATLTVARSVLDVLVSYMNRSPVNHFSEYGWSGYSRSGEGGPLQAPQSGTPYGEYRARATQGALMFDLAIGLSLGTQAFLGAGRPPTRWRAGTEALLAWTPGGRWLYKGGVLRLIPQVGLTVGYDFVKGTNLSGHGVGARLIKPVTQLNLQFSAVARYAWYRAGPAHLAVSAFEWGGRFEIGFGLVFLGVGVERVAAPTESMPDARRTSVTTFVTVHPPRLFGLFP